MSVTATHLTTDTNVNSSSTFTTAFISPTVGRLVIAAVGTDGGGVTTPNTPTLSGCNLTWTLIGTFEQATSRMSFYRALAINPTTGQVTINTGGQAGFDYGWSFVEFGNIDLSGTNGSGAIVQSAGGFSQTGTSLSVTLGAFSDTDNATFGAAYANGVANVTPGSGFTELGEAKNLRTFQSQWKASNDTTVDWTYSTSLKKIGAAIEIKEKIYEVLGGMI